MHSFKVVSSCLIIRVEKRDNILKPHTKLGDYHHEFVNSEPDFLKLLSLFTFPLRDEIHDTISFISCSFVVYHHTSDMHHVKIE